jgi:hypothetical protein
MTFHVYNCNFNADLGLTQWWIQKRKLGGGGQMASAVARAYSGGLGARPQWGPVYNLLSSWGRYGPFGPPPPKSAYGLTDKLTKYS